MTVPSDASRRSGRDILRIFFSGRMLTALLMGFSSGLPLLLATGSVLQAWLKEAGVDLGTIGLFALVGLPYTLKFLWAPLLDRFAPITGMGRRRGWLLLIQITLIAAIAGLGLTDPARSLPGVTLAAFLVAFFSASQDIVIDAYRRESLADDEQGLGASLYVNGYRIGLLLSSGGGLILADFIPFQAVYGAMAAAMLPGLVTTLLCVEPDVPMGTPRTLRDAVVQPFVEYFSRQDAVLILLFVLLYKVGEMMASQMTTPFYLDLEFTKTEIGAVVKLFGFWATVIGGLLGGVLMLRLGLYRALWLFGVLQAIGLVGFVILARLGHSLPGLALAVSSENLFSGMATTAYVAFMATLTNKKFTATQYALLSSLMGIPRVIVNTPTGYLAEWLGWEGFFLFCMASTVPGLWLLTRFRAWMEAEPAAPRD
ncbi:MAG: AmpG family muropeptide MFS transporter [Candidatus Contendobacter sp.]|nr:AmpG family muropeptide MFS transporter [Candidatus Contendobacter sp.]MDG4556331.1 AmpG family muropeptide MFS transporter [Candidatus Contendobacter sp.]